MTRDGLLLIMIILIIFIVFLVAFLLVYKNNIKKERDMLIKEILITSPKPSSYNKIRNLGYEDSYGWIWNDRLIKELSYNDLLDIYKIIE